MSRRFALAATLTVLAVRRVHRARLVRTHGRYAVPRHDHRRQRQGHRLEVTEPHRLALADGDRDALRDRRGRAGRRGRRPVRLPEAPRRGRRSPATRRTSRRSRGYRPDLVVISFDPKGLSRRSAARHPGRVPQRGRDAPRGVPADPAAVGHGARDGVEPARRGHEAADRVDRRTVDGPRAPARRSTTSSTRRSTASRRARSSVACTPVRPPEHRRRGQAGGSDYPQLSPEHVIASDPDLIVPRRHRLLRAARADRRGAARLVADRGGAHG